MTALLVTNDFPPKVGGIQSYLWELWRRLPPEQATVLTTAHPGAGAFDAEQAYRVVRAGRVLLPTPALVRQVRALATEVGAGVVVLDPALPVGLIGPRLGLPYAVVLHGAEVTVPGRLPGSRAALAHVLAGAVHLVAAGGYPAAEARRAARGAVPPVTLVPPGVDGERFRPSTDEGRAKARADFGLPEGADLVVGVSRLVPRKGMDTLVRAAALLAPGRPELVVAVAGQGRDMQRLHRLAAGTVAPVRFLGRVPDDRLPALYGCADVFAAPCRSRWRGLEQEGFGIVFLEAAACGVPQVAGDSGGAAEAVVDGETGVVVRRPSDPASVAAAIAGLLDDPVRRRAMGAAARRRAVEHFSYDRLAARLSGVLAGLGR
ncbi:MAG: glycosyltransferase family 4 protein [Acidimicrobiales bacterium]